MYADSSQTVVVSQSLSIEKVMKHNCLQEKRGQDHVKIQSHLLFQALVSQVKDRGHHRQELPLKGLSRKARSGTDRKEKAYIVHILDSKSETSQIAVSSSWLESEVGINVRRVGWLHFGRHCSHSTSRQLCTQLLIKDLILRPYKTTLAIFWFARRIICCWRQENDLVVSETSEWWGNKYKIMLAKVSLQWSYVHRGWRSNSRSCC